MCVVEYKFLTVTYTTPNCSWYVCVEVTELKKTQSLPLRPTVDSVSGIFFYTCMIISGLHNSHSEHPLLMAIFH